MILKDLERRNNPYFAFFSPNSIAVQADYLTVKDIPIPVAYATTRRCHWLQLFYSCMIIAAPDLLQESCKTCTTLILVLLANVNA